MTFCFDFPSIQLSLVRACLSVVLENDYSCEKKDEVVFQEEIII